MLLKTLVYKKKDLTTVTETSTLEEALKILETSFICWFLLLLRFGGSGSMPNTLHPLVPLFYH